MVENRNAYTILVGRPEVKRPIGKPRCMLDDNIKMDPRELGEGGGDMVWIDLSQDMDRWRALVSTVMNLRVP
jgi:hypothetical protein